jgi:hypothetical protein
MLCRSKQEPKYKNKLYNNEIVKQTENLLQRRKFLQKLHESVMKQVHVEASLAVLYSGLHDLKFEPTSNWCVRTRNSFFTFQGICAVPSQIHRVACCQRNTRASNKIIDGVGDER